jgi:hypothetical protein
VVDPATSEADGVDSRERRHGRPGVLYWGIKYDPKPVVGATVTQPYPTVTYTFLTSVNNTVIIASQDSLSLKPKSAISAQSNDGSLQTGSAQNLKLFLPFVATSE